MIVPNCPSETPGELQGPHVVTSKDLRESSLPPRVTICLGEQLRAHYSRLVAEPIPVFFLQILEALDQKRRLGHG
jgi:Anti-sigma factor NepR